MVVRKVRVRQKKARLIASTFVAANRYVDSSRSHAVDILPALKDGDSSAHGEELPISQKSLAKRNNGPSVQQWLSPQA